VARQDAYNNATLTVDRLCAERAAAQAAAAEEERAAKEAEEAIVLQSDPPQVVTTPEVPVDPPPQENQAPTTEASSPATESPAVDADPPADPSAAIVTEGQVTGLATIPPAWPALPPTASLAADVGWVQSSRLDVVEQLAGGRYRVDLSRADRPAPSKSALSWLETSISFPAKFADVSVKAAQGTTDEQAEVRREKLSIEEVRRLLAEMVTARTEAAAVEAEAGAG
jgi:hypothetical protein